MIKKLILIHLLVGTAILLLLVVNVERFQSWTSSDSDIQPTTIKVQPREPKIIPEPKTSPSFLMQLSKKEITIFSCVLVACSAYWLKKAISIGLREYGDSVSTVVEVVEVVEVDVGKAQSVLYYVTEEDEEEGFQEHKSQYKSQCK